MKASIIIPAYNEENYLAATLDAVFAQDYPNFEVIVVDNASTDRTAQVIARYPKVVAVYESKKGTNQAREAGRARATGTIVVTIDADCRPSVNWLSRAMRHFEDNRVVAVSGPSYYFDGSFWFRSASLIVQYIFYKPVGSIFQFFGLNGVLIANNCLMRKQALDQAKGFDVQYTFWGDDTATAKSLRPYGYIVFDNALYMPNSARRFNREGVLKTFYQYIVHFCKVTFKL